MSEVGCWIKYFNDLIDILVVKRTLVNSIGKISCGVSNVEDNNGS